MKDNSKKVQLVLVLLLLLIIFDNYLLSETSRGNQTAKLSQDIIANRSIPVNLGYFIISTQMKNLKTFSNIPDGVVTKFSLNFSNNPQKKEIEKKIEELFDGQFNRMNFIAISGNVSFETPRMSHNTKIVNIKVINRTISKNKHLISGEVFFKPMDESQNLIKSKFSVESKTDQVLIYRLGNVLDMIVLCFSKKSQDLQSEDEFVIYQKKINNQLELLLNKLDLEKEIFYPMQVNSISGCEVQTSMETINIKNLNKGNTDFSESEVLFHSDKGNWKLFGNIMHIGKKREFIARKGILLNPKGKIMAAGINLTVPIDKPYMFKIKKNNNIYTGE